MIRKHRLAIIALFLASPLAGCGGPDVDSPTPKSEYAPTQAQLDEMTKNAMPQTGKHSKKSR